MASSDNFFAFLEELDPLNRHQIEQLCRRVDYRAGQYICFQGSEADSVFIVRGGVVEVVTQSSDGVQSRSIANLRRGDTFGELSVLTDYPRSAGVRALEDAQIYVLEKKDFRHLLRRIPAFAEMVAAQLAVRLHQATASGRHRDYCIDFGGNLLKFDILLVFQAILSSGQKGELRLLNSANDLLGAFFFSHHTVPYARFAHLEGMQAIGQAFLHPATEGSFAFQIMDEPALVYDLAQENKQEGMSILMEAASQRDMFQSQPLFLRKLEACVSLAPGAEAVAAAATDPLRQRIAQLILRRPQHLSSLWRRLDVSSYTLIVTVRELEAEGLVTVEPAAPAAAVA